MFKVLDVFPIGAMLSVTLSGACDKLHNGSKLVGKNGKEITIISVAMTRNNNPADIGNSTTVLIEKCDIAEGMELSTA